jgi:hypothetical protein
MAVVRLIAIGLMAMSAAGPILRSARTQHQAADTQLAVKRPYRNSSSRLHLNPAGRANSNSLRRLTAKPEQRPRVVCGMVVIPVSPAADPKMVVQSKDAPKPDFKIRVIEPRICNQ